MLRSCFLCLLLAWIGIPAGVAQPGPYRIETVAGSSNIGDGGPATSAQITNIQGIALDSAGNLYLTDTDNARIRKVAANGTITTLAGTGVAGYSGDGGPAASAQLNLPYGWRSTVPARYLWPTWAITGCGGSGRTEPFPPWPETAPCSAGDGGLATAASLIGPPTWPSTPRATCISRNLRVSASAKWPLTEPFRPLPAPVWRGSAATMARPPRRNWRTRRG